MNYREKLLDLMLHAEDDDIMKWIASQPLIEQPDILRELKALIEDIEQDAGMDLGDMLTEFDDFIETYEDKILDEKLAEANYVMALQEQERAFEEMDKAIMGVRAYVIECILTDAPNAEAMRELAQKIIQLEKDSGNYDPANWKGIV